MLIICQRTTNVKAIVDAEWDILYEKLQKIKDSGAIVVLSKLPIGDVATQWFADRYVAFFIFDQFSTLPSFFPLVLLYIQKLLCVKLLCETEIRN